MSLSSIDSPHAFSPVLEIVVKRHKEFNQQKEISGLIELYNKLNKNISTKKI